MDLVALMMDDLETAKEARLECGKMAEEHLLVLGDAVVVYKDDNGEIQLDQMLNLTKAGAIGGASWGTLMGLLFSIFAGPGMILAGALGGAAGGALSGKFSDYGISDDMMRQTGSALDEGKAILFLLGKTEAGDKVLERLAPFGGTVVKSNLSSEVDERINAALAGTSEA